MKRISSTRKPYLLAACLTLCLAAGAGLASAATDTPPFVQVGSSVTTPGANTTYAGATFQDGANPYTVTISPASGQTATLNNGNSIVLVGDGSTITVASGITINESAGGTGALDITGGGTVTNAGSVTSTSFDGIDIGGAGTVNNSGTVTSENFGIHIGGAGTVTSSNSIIANGNTGIFIGSTGNVNLTGTLTAENYGIYIGADGMVTVSNTLIANGNTAINIGGTGTVTLTAAVTAENYGVNIGGNGTVTNSSILTGQGNDAVLIGGTGTVINTGSMISNADSAIVINGVGNVTNTGLLQGNSNEGVHIGGSSTLFSSITNSSTGTIGGITAIEIDGLANVTNAGTVTSSGNSAIIIQGSPNGTSTVNNSGTVLSTVNGIYITSNNAANVINSGRVSGTNYGVQMNGTGSFTNNGGTVTGGINGVYINGTTTASTVNLNAGSVTGTANDGLYLDGGSTVNLLAGASVSGGINGILITGSGSVTDAGSILAHNNVGIFINNTGTLVVLPSGSVTGAWNGIQVNGSGSLVNTGTIIGQGNFGVYFGGTGALTLPGGSISGPGAAIVTNSAASSVSVWGRASLTNGSGGSGLIYNNVGIGSLNLNLAGMTPAELASFNAQLGNTSGDILAGGEEYRWQNFLLSGHAYSLEQVVDPGLLEIATKLDNLSTPLPLAYDPFYVAAANNPEAALNSLVGREFDDALGVISKNDATALSDVFDSYAFDLRSGTGGFDLSGLNVTSGSLIASLGDTESTLGRLMGASAMGGTTMSDSKEVISQSADNNRWGAWASGTVTLGDESTTASGPGFNYTTGSPTIGADYRICNNFAMGALLNFSTTGANFSDGSRLGVQTGLGALYGTWSDGPWYVNGLAGGGYSSYDNRRVTIPGTTATSSPDGDEVLANLTGGYDFKLGGGWKISPEGGFLYTHVTENGYTENGAGAFDLTLADQNLDSLRSKLGFHVIDNFKWDGIAFTPQFRASWYHEILDDSRGVATSLGGAPALGSFTVQTNDEGRDFADLGAGISATPAELSGSVTFFVNYDAQVGQDNFIAHTVNGGLRVNF